MVADFGRGERFFVERAFGVLVVWAWLSSLKVSREDLLEREKSTTILSFVISSFALRHYEGPRKTTLELKRRFVMDWPEAP